MRSRQAAGMNDVTRLRKELDSHFADGLAQAGCGGLECRKAAVAPGCKLGLKRGQGFAAENRREGLVKSIYRGCGDGAAGDSGVMQQKSQERRRQEWEIDRQKDSVAREGGSERRADAGQRAKIGMRIFDDGGEGFKRRAGQRARMVHSFRRRGPVCGDTGNRCGDARLAQDGKRMRYQRLTGEQQLRLVVAHAAGLAAGEDKARGVVK